MLQIDRLKATAVRNLVSLDISPVSNINYFYGANASGKTSVLETIYLLSRVKSFRSSRINNVIRHGEKLLSVYAEGKQRQQGFRIGVEKGHGVVKLKVNGQLVQSASEQAKAFPVFLVAPDHNLLFYGGPKQRRHWLDWALFHVEQDYLETWKNYHRAARHRNTLLQKLAGVSNSELTGWEKLMAAESEKIDDARKRYIQYLNSKMSAEFLPRVLDGEVEIEYTNSRAGEALLDMLVNHRQEDYRRGYTTHGPHRADIRFYLSGLDIAKHLSRGQIKLFGAALTTAQVDQLDGQNQGSIVLVDDIDAELDKASTTRIFDLLSGNKAQVFVTSLTEPEKQLVEQKNNAVFHVEQGRVQRV